MTLQERLNEIARELRGNKEVPPIPLRDLLYWNNARRRGFYVVTGLRLALERAGLETVPDFESAYLGSDIKFVLTKKLPVEVGSITLSGTGVGTVTATVSQADPTYRISKLAAANKPPVSVPPDATVQQAATAMLANDFSQLPVMTNERDVKGVVSRISIGTRLVLGKSVASVRDLMDHHHEIRADSSLFDAIPIIVRHDYVLVRGADNRIIGIVTASDLSLQFQQLAEPFLLLGEIENHVRRILADNFSSDELASVGGGEGEHKVDGVDDLTFGGYIRLLENGDRWKKISLPIDRTMFCKHLDRVRTIRNDVMHFDPDGIVTDDLERLRDCAIFATTPDSRSAVASLGTTSGRQTKRAALSKCAKTRHSSGVGDVQVIR